MRWLLAAAHFVFLLGVLAGKPVQPYTQDWHGDMVAARHFHYPDDHLLVQFVSAVDFPAVLLGSITVTPLAERFLSPLHASYVDAASWLLLGSAQWFLFGYLIDLNAARRGGGAGRVRGS